MDDQILIVGDIAGRYNELMKLREEARKCFGEFSLVAVGDLVDRGPDSNKVVEFFRTDSNSFAIKGNHEDMMVDWCKTPRDQTPVYNTAFKWDVWLGNGGGQTLRSYLMESEGIKNLENLQKWVDGRTDPYGDLQTFVPKEHIEYLDNLPLFLEHEDSFGKFLVTHGPINPVYGLEKAARVDQNDQMSLCWNRGSPRRIEGVDMQFHGHNALNGVKWHTDKIGKFGCNMDTSRASILTGVLWPTYEVVQVEYMDD